MTMLHLHAHRNLRSSFAILMFSDFRLLRRILTSLISSHDSFQTPRPYGRVQCRELLPVLHKQQTFCIHGSFPEDHGTVPSMLTVRRTLSSSPPLYQANLDSQKGSGKFSATTSVSNLRILLSFQYIFCRGMMGKR